MESGAKSNFHSTSENAERAGPFLVDTEGSPPLQSTPQAPFRHLHALWFQITGTLCNLECVHCFISCSPTNDHLKFLEPDTVYRYLEEAIQLGVREIYFTGGEPFLHKQMLPILERALQVAPTTVLTNGTLITPTVADALGTLQAASRYSLEIRISLDDIDAARNDAVRGKGAWRRALRAMHLLQDRGILPIVAVTEYLYDANPAAQPPGYAPGEGSGFYQKFRNFLLENGIVKPRLKMIPVFAMGQLQGTVPLAAYVTPEMMQGFDADTLQCTATRIVADGGVYACPILVGEAGALLSTESLTSALEPCTLYHTACHTCYVTGMTCANY
jgi:MoaA/NifB/PqqE/SkfB family radical SAM enzyme